MPLSVIGAGGGSDPNPPGRELQYALLTGNYPVPDASDATHIPTLDVTCTPAAGTTYVVEFYCSAVDEDSGVTAGELVKVALSIRGGATLSSGIVLQGDGGVGGALFMKTKSLTADGSEVTFEVTVQNITTGTDGVILEAGPATPAYVRVLTV